MATMLATLAIVQLAALAGLWLAATYSVQLVDEHGRPIKRREPEPRAGELPDPSGYRHSTSHLAKPRFLA
jgi:hypothetical protein